MRKTLLIVAIVVVGLLALGCSGGTSTGGSTDDGSDTGSGSAGEASVAALSTVPSIDISSLDFSQTSTGTSFVPSSSSLGALTVNSNGVQSLGDNLGAVGNSSRAGCEANMHKKEMIRMSQEAQLDRCYPEAMETAGLITIPEGELALYRVKPPEHSEDDRARFCDDIPDEFTQEKAACEAGEGPGDGGSILIRIGIIDGELQIDMCEGEEGSEVLIDEATYSANGSVYTASVVRIGTWGGHEESASFSMTVDLGEDGTVTNGGVDLGTAGSARATGIMSGGFGSGAMTFIADGATGSNIISGAFGGEFIDPFTDAPTSFTGKVHSQFGGSTNTGTAKFSFTGSMPPFPVTEMLPMNMPQADVENFLSALSTELGLQLTTSSLLCPNPDFDHESFDESVKPMVLPGDDGTCGEVTHTGVESFAITNGTIDGDFASEIAQSFVIIADVDSAFFDTINAFDLSTLDAAIETVSFSRNWDCAGDFTDLDFESFTDEQMTVADQALQTCFALEEKLHGNEGMGGYNCGQQEHQEGVNDFAEGGGPNFGPYGGEYRWVSDNCGNESPDFLFVDSLDPEADKYCFPADGGCEEFTITGNDLTGLNIGLWGELAITDLSYTQSGEDPATAVQVAFNSGCVANYNIVQPSFDAPPEFGGGPGEGHEDFIPQPCLDAGLTTEETCMQLCQDPSVDCFE